MPTRKPLRLPPKDLSRLKLREVTLPETGWVRLHWPTRALHFQLNDEHRFSPATSPWKVLYCAQDVTTAALEVFGDRLYKKHSVVIPRSEWDTKEITPIRLPLVKVADLTKAGMSAARVDITALSHRDRSVTHKWALAVINHSTGFHGLLFHSRFTLGVCVALYEVPGDPAPTSDGPAVPWHTLPEAAKMLADYRVALS